MNGTESSDTLKKAGNASFQAGDFTEAIKHFTDAVAVDAENHVLYSNRSGMYHSPFFHLLMHTPLLSHTL